MHPPVVVPHEGPTTHQLVYDAHFYLKAPDGLLPAGTEVHLLNGYGNLCRVQAADGTVVGYVEHQALQPLTQLKAPRAARQETAANQETPPSLFDLYALKAPALDDLRTVMASLHKAAAEYSEQSWSHKKDDLMQPIAPQDDKADDEDEPLDLDRDVQRDEDEEPLELDLSGQEDTREEPESPLDLDLSVQEGGKEGPDKVPGGPRGGRAPDRPVPTVSRRSSSSSASSRQPAGLNEAFLRAPHGNNASRGSSDDDYSLYKDNEDDEDGDDKPSPPGPRQGTKDSFGKDHEDSFSVTSDD